MYRIFYAEKDTTLYEKYPKQNTGVDQILELTKIASGSKLDGAIQADTYNTRILIDFGSEITTLATAITAGSIPPIGNGTNSASVYLNLRAADATDLYQEYTIKAFPVSESWDNGNGSFGDEPQRKVGASWYYKEGDAVASNAVYWNTGSAHSNGQMGVTETLYGGGTWITGSTYEASQSFNNEAPDIRMNVTDIIKHWTSGSITNNGFMIKRTDANERDGKNWGKLKFFSRETHTIYNPRLEVAWDNTTFANTSSTEISADTYTPYFKNIKQEYRTSEISKFRVGVRPEFPTRTYQTSSFYLTGERLPTSSYYSILDSVTDETIIPFDTTATQIDCDANGSFFKLRMDSFMPERYYKIMLKIERGSNDDVQTFDDYYFKVVK